MRCPAARVPFLSDPFRSAPLRLVSSCSALVLFALLLPALGGRTAAQQPLGDLNPFRADPDSSPGPFAPFGGSVVFAATTAATGREVWGLGPGGGAQLLADLSPGSANPEHLTWVGTRVFFVADDGAGRGPWVLDPLAGFVRKLGVLEVRDESLYLPVPQLHALGNQLLFFADDGVTGTELWRSDGTIAGTQRVRELEPGRAGGLLVGATVLGTELFFALRTPETSPTGTLLVRTDGTAAGTIVIARSDQGGPEIRGRIVTAGTQAFFAGSTGTTPNYELWATDGTPAGTRQVVDWNPNLGSFVGELIALGNRVAYVADVTGVGQEPVLSDGTAAGSYVIDINPSPNLGSTPYHLTAMGGDVYLYANGLAGSGLYRIDGGQRTPGLLAPMRWTPGPTAFIVAAGSRVFCRGIEASAVNRTSAQLWTSDGTPAGTIPLRDLRQGLADARFAYMTAVGSGVVFAADDGLVGLEPWRSDGTSTGTNVAANVNADPTARGVGSAPTFFLPARQAIVFDADDGQLGRELWRTDGTAAGTALLRDLLPGAEGSRLIGLGAVRDDALFVSAPAGTGRADYYATDGTAAGTRQLSPPGLMSAPLAGSAVLDPGRAVFSFVNRLDGFGTSPQDWTLLRAAPEGVSAVATLGLGLLPHDLALVGTVPFFAATTPIAGYELWTVTAGLAQQVADIRPGSASSDPGASLRVALGNVLLFSADDGTHGVELWRSDGTAAGTRMVLDLWPGATGSTPRTAVRWGGVVVFVADTPAAGTELWVTDGTAAGTALIDLLPGSAGSQPQQLLATADALFFSADDGVVGREPYALDTSGVRRIADVRPGPRGSNPHDFVAAGPTQVLFVADDGVEGEELWTSDGTAAGARRLGVRAGPTSSDPHAVLAASDRRVLFVADDGTHGAEPWVVARLAAARPFAPACGVATTVLRVDDPVLGATMRVEVTRATGGLLGGLFLLGLPGTLQFGGCTLHVDLAGVALPFAFTNGWNATLTVPNDPSLVDVPLRAQAVLGPFAAPPGLSSSDAWSLQSGT